MGAVILQRYTPPGVMAGVVLGIESTAHTLSFGMVDMDGKTSQSYSNLFRPKEGGIHPREAADHHCLMASDLLRQATSSEMFLDNKWSRSYCIQPRPWLRAMFENRGKYCQNAF